MARNDAEIKLRLPHAQLEEWKAYATECGLPLSQVIRTTIDAAVRVDAVIKEPAPESQVPALVYEGPLEFENTTPSRRCKHGRQGWCPVCDR